MLSRLASLAVCLALLFAAACTPTLQIYTEHPEEHAQLVADAGKLAGIRTKLADAPGRGVVTVEVRPQEGDKCGRALELIVRTDSLSEALTKGVINCEPKAWTCDHAKFLTHELGHVIGLLRHSKTGLMAPAPDLANAELTEEEKLRIRAMAVVWIEVCR